MAYFKILPILRDKYVDMGMLNISAELYLEQGDEGYDKYIAEHFVTVPIIPEGGYTGKFNKDGVPVNQTDYDNWIKSLPTVQQLNPFCTHSIQFEADVTEEEILWCFEFALGITHRNYLIDNLHCQKGGQVVNQLFHYSERKRFYKNIKEVMEYQTNKIGGVVTTDEVIESFLKTGFEEGEAKEFIRTEMKSSIEKVTKAESKLNQIKDINFANIKTIGKYSVRK